MTGGGYKREYIKDNDASLLPTLLKLAFGVTGSKMHIAFGAQKIIDLMYNLVSFEDFAFKFNSHGLFDSYHKTQSGQRFRSLNVQANYIGSSFQTFNTNYKVNNLYRPDTVVIQSDDILPIPQNLGAPIDKSRYTVGGDADESFGNEYIVNPNIESN